jgi:O-antigen ligase
MIALLRSLFLLLIFALPFARPYLFIAGGYPVMVSDVLFLGCFALLLCSVLTRRLRIEYDPLLIPLALYGGALTTSAFFSEDISFSLTKLGGEFYLFGLFFLARQVASDEQFRSRVAVAWTGGAIIAIIAGIVGIGLFALGHTNQTDNFFLSHKGSLPSGEYPRLLSFFANTNMLANYLNASVGFIVIALSSKRVPGPTRGIFAIGFLSNLLLTFSTGIGGVAISVSIWLRDQLRLRNHFVRGSAIMISGALVALLFLVSAGISPKSIKSSMPGTQGVGFQLETSARILLWEESLKTFIANPLTGKGLGLDTADIRYSAASGNELRLRDAHNSFLNIAGQSGTLGLFSFLFLLYALFRRMSFESIGGDASLMLLSASVLGCLYYGGLTGSFENARHIWLLLGIFAATSARNRQAEPPTLNS